MKVSEFRNLTDEELVARREELKRELFNLRLQASSGQLEKPSRIKEVRRGLAKLETVSSERRREAGTQL